MSTCSPVQYPPMPTGWQQSPSNSAWLRGEGWGGVAGGCCLVGELRPQRQELRFPTASALLCQDPRLNGCVEGTQLTSPGHDSVNHVPVPTAVSGPHPDSSGLPLGSPDPWLASAQSQLCCVVPLLPLQPGRLRPNSPPSPGLCECGPLQAIPVYFHHKL